MDFSPNLTPKEIINLGSFGGVYFDTCGGKIDIDYKEFPTDWFENLPDSHYKSKVYNKNVNFFKVKCGQTQEEWEEKGWINKQDQRGWFQWYCRYFLGRRSDDDDRQIRRWNNFCGEKGRFRNNIYKKIFDRNTNINDNSFSLALRQSLLHWGYRLNEGDYEMWKVKNLI